jgi:hypothetical protein
MSTPTDLTPGITQTAQGPAAMQTDAGAVTAMPIASQILADQYLAAKAASKLKHRGLRFTKLIGPAQCPAVNPAIGGFNADGSFAG